MATSVFRVLTAAEMVGPNITSTDVKKTLSPNVVWRGVVETSGVLRCVGRVCGVGGVGMWGKRTRVSLPTHTTCPLHVEGVGPRAAWFRPRAGPRHTCNDHGVTCHAFAWLALFGGGGLEPWRSECEVVFWHGCRATRIFVCPSMFRVASCPTRAPAPLTTSLLSLTFCLAYGCVRGRSMEGAGWPRRIFL
jgi:hypothetical protein